MNDEENKKQRLKQAAKEWFDWENKKLEYSHKRGTRIIKEI